VVDLLLLAVDSGLTVRLALEEVAGRAQGVVVGRVEAALRRVHAGARLADVLDELQDEVGDAGRPLLAALLDAERYGTPLAEPLERIGADLANQRRRQSEEAARRVPVKLLFPLVFCTLPAFALLTVVPLLAGSLPTLPE
jgi:tight adherence protein C